MPHEDDEPAETHPVRSAMWYGRATMGRAIARVTPACESPDHRQAPSLCGRLHKLPLPRSRESSARATLCGTVPPVCVLSRSPTEIRPASSPTRPRVRRKRPGSVQHRRQPVPVAFLGLSQPTELMSLLTSPAASSIAGGTAQHHRRANRLDLAVRVAPTAPQSVPSVPKSRPERQSTESRSAVATVRPRHRWS
jgi:hypothetical protein